MHAGGFIEKTNEYYVSDKSTVSVPRCERCKTVHDRVEGYVAKGAISGLLLGVMIALLYLYEEGFDSMLDKGTWKNALIVTGITGMIGGVLVWALGRISIPKGVKDQSARNHYPLVQQQVQEGWKIGPKPPGL